MRFGMYRWHDVDPVRFASDLRITVQALGWRKRRTLPSVTGRLGVSSLLVPDAAGGGVSRASRARPAGNHLIRRSTVNQFRRYRDNGAPLEGAPLEEYG